MITAKEIDALQDGDTVVLASAEEIVASRGAAYVMKEKAGETHVVRAVFHSGPGRVEFGLSPALQEYSTGVHDFYFTEGAIAAIVPLKLEQSSISLDDLLFGTEAKDV